MKELLKRFDMLIKRKNSLSSKYVIMPNGCWYWIECRGKNKYGVIKIHGLAFQAHVIMYRKFKGSYDPSLELDHLCEHKNCVNPDHLEPVTHRENVRRAVRKRMQRFSDDVRIYYQAGMSKDEILIQFGISLKQLDKIINFERPYDSENPAEDL